jgi:hypothetical protein
MGARRVRIGTQWFLSVDEGRRLEVVAVGDRGRSMHDVEYPLLTVLADEETEELWVELYTSKGAIHVELAALRAALELAVGEVHSDAWCQRRAADWRNHLDDEETALAIWALREIADTREIEDWEFETIFGTPRRTFAEMADGWGDWGDLEELRASTVSAIGNILGYPGYRVDAARVRSLEPLSAKLVELAPSE